LVSFTEFRKRTAVATPARLNAIARLPWITIRIPAIVGARMMLLCITAGSYSCSGLVRLYASATGKVSRIAPIMASAVARTAPHCHSMTGSSSASGRVTFR
jgi:hypothetical protein